MIYYYRYLFVKMKVFNYSELHFAEVTFYKIHTLINPIFSWNKKLNKFITKRGLKRKILWVEVNDEGNGKKTKKLSRPEFIFNVVLSWSFSLFFTIDSVFPPLFSGDLLFKFGVSSAIYCTYERLRVNYLHLWGFLHHIRKKITWAIFPELVLNSKTPWT